MTLRISPSPLALTWANYRRVPADPDGNGYSANTAWRMQAINIAVTGEGGGGYAIKTLLVVVGLHNRACWVVRGSTTNALLLHERLHYLFATMVAEELHATLLGLRANTVGELQAALQSAMSDATARTHAISQTYDDETRHGMDTHAQVGWQARAQSWQAQGQISFAAP